MTPLRPALLVGIDTEGDNQWDAAARRRQTFENIYALERLHERFAPSAYGRPISSRTRSLVTQGAPRCFDGCWHGVIARSARTITHGKRPRAIQPMSTVTRTRLSLPLPQFDDQLASLTRTIARGRWPAADILPIGSIRVFCRARLVSRAAGLSTSTRASRRSSTRPTKADRISSDAPIAPYFVSYDNPTAPGSSTLLELPVSAALNRRVPAWVERRYGRAPWPYTTKRLIRLARLAHVRWLRPSYSSAEDMIALARQLTARGVPLLNVIFHSSEAIVGGSPYNRTEQELTDFFGRLGRLLDTAVLEMGAVPMTFSEFRRRVVSAPYPALARASA